MLYLRPCAIFCFIIMFASSSHGNEESAALTISGGISLGVYEAGLNYILLESFNNADKLPNIKIFTGASAGAINALTSSLHSCIDPAKYSNSITDNLFRDIWINVDIKDLIPKDQEKYNTLFVGGEDESGVLNSIDDSLLSRGVFLEPIDKLRNIYSSNIFKKDCSALVGIIVTLTQPNKIKIAVNINEPENIELPVQSYAVALRLETTPHKDGYRPVFKNIDIEDIDPKLLYQSKRKYIRLLENQNKVVSLESVIRASLASSAFPLAFESIDFPYCIKEETPKDPVHGCPNNYSKKQGKFIDGGVFDNIPLGLAVELSSSLNRIDKEKYIYLDPDNLTTDKLSSINPSPEFSIASQINSIVPSITTLRKQILRKDLENFFDYKNRNNVKRNYSPTKRSPALTGNFLGAFGAFFDARFRDYDYMAGIYDGLRYSSIQLCKSSANKAQCEAQKFNHLAKKHIKGNSRDNKAIKHQLGLFLCYEFGVINFKATSLCKPLNNAYSDTISQLINNQEEPLITLIYQSLPGSVKFKDFLKTLLTNLEKHKKDNDTYIQYSSQLNYMMRQPGFWMNLFSQNILERLIIREKLANGDASQILMPAYIMTAPEILSQKYDIEPSDKYNTWYIPDRFGIDAAQTGLVVNFSREANKICLLVISCQGIGNNYIQTGVTANLQWKDDERNDVAYLNLGARRPRPSLFWSSTGFDITVNRNILSDDNYSLGFEINIGILAENIRFSAGTRDVLHNREDEDYILKLSISNIDRMIWAAN